MKTSIRFRRSVRWLFAFACWLAVQTVAVAQSLDTSDMTAEAGQLLTLLKVIAAVAAVAAIIFGALAIRGRNIGEGLLGLLCAIGAIFIIGHAQAWVTGITGIALP